jgi:hypothetical protein
MPGHAGAADADRITDRPLPGQNEIKLALAGDDNDGAGRLAAHGDDIARLRDAGGLRQ